MIERTLVPPTGAAAVIVRIVLIAAFVTGCGGDSSGPPPTPASVVAISGNPAASAVVGIALARAPEFEVRSAGGRALAGVPVTVTVTTGGGTLTGAPAVTLAGPTPIGTWVLGTVAGPQSVTVTVADIAPLVFTIEAAADAPTELEIVDGHNQFGTVQTAVAIPLRVRVLDAFDNLVVGAAVIWTVDAGGGSLAGTTSMSNAQGIATAPTWTLGADGSGTQTVRASLSALSARFNALMGLRPASIVVETAPPATSEVGTALATAPAFTVRDSGGVAISGFPVSIAVTAGGGSIAAAPTATTSGSTAIGTWTLGRTASAQSATVTVPGLPTTVLTLQATPGPVDTVAVLSGNGQTAFAGDFVFAPMRVRLADRFGNAVSGATIGWSVTAGGGSVAFSTTVSAANGEANAPGWRLGRFLAPQQLRGTVNFRTVVFDATIETQYTVDVRFIGPAPSSLVQQAFTNAANRIAAAVVGDVPNFQASNFDIAVVCGVAGGPVLNETIDDIIIYASVDSIDGPGKVLGNAGPCAGRSAGGLPAIGRMLFDEADLEGMVASGRLETVILHEMLHVVGVGTTWDANGLLVDPTTATARFIGELARLACVNDHGGSVPCSSAVPVENCLDLPSTTTCGPGTQDSHWKESIFRGELMTGYLSADVNPFSKMSIQSLADIGYEVNEFAADPYHLSSALVALRAPGGLPDLQMPEPLRPRFTIDQFGNITPIPDR